MADAKFLIPEITDDDIDWVCSLLGFDTFDESQRAYLKHRTTVDVSACPGSGKTTLIVAKLALLAKNWPHRTKGICVLSHTNVAREQIEHRLGRTVVGQRLLTYPHFIGTIHSFVNRFLALPWLHSEGEPSPTIDNDATTAERRRVLGERKYYKLQYFLSNRQSSFNKLRICDRHLNFNLIDKPDKPFPAQQSKPSYQNAELAIKETAKAGYFCHDEMFVWANALLEDYEAVPLWLAHRFPLVILDEMQDTSKQQAPLLNTVFPRESDKIIVQRLGDPNQRIFDSTGADPNETADFPDSETDHYLEIPNSYRFGVEIAKFASPFAANPVGQDGLCGVGPGWINSEDQENKHAIIVFPDNDTNDVLETYGKHVLSVFGDETLAKGSIVAVGHVHQNDSDVTSGHHQYPKSVGHYWSNYSVETPRQNPYPPTLAQYIYMAQGLVTENKALSPGVEQIASGIVELARLLGNIGNLKRKTRTHRAILEVLESNTDALMTYRGVLRRFLIDRTVLSEDNWTTHAEDIVTVASALCREGADRNEPKEFLEWPQDALLLKRMEPSLSDDSGLNVFRVSDGTRNIDIRLGSIHSVKGQTHLATLLLSTYWHDHSAKQIMPWLVGKKSNGKGEGKRNYQRLLHTYVAITRPSHLLCLAVPHSALGSNQTAIDKSLATLMERGWSIAELVEGTPHWRK